jgi:hypothetical protein
MTDVVNHDEESFPFEDEDLKFTNFLRKKKVKKHQTKYWQLYIKNNYDSRKTIKQIKKIITEEEKEEESSYIIP